MSGERANLVTERLALRIVEGSKELGLSHTKPFVEMGEKRNTLLRGDDPASPPIRWIGAPLNQGGRFEIIEEVGHHRPVDPEMLSECQLATDTALGGCRQHLIPRGPPGRSATAACAAFT